LNINLDELLTKAKELLKEEMSSVSYLTWIEPLAIHSVNDNDVVLICNDPFKRENLETRMYDLVSNTFSILLQKKCTLSVVSEGQEASDTASSNAFTASSKASRSS
jgi:chromosomal replication initiator protein